MVGEINNKAYSAQLELELGLSFANIIGWIVGWLYNDTC
jgi:hypothetical protein